MLTLWSSQIVHDAYACCKVRVSWKYVSTMTYIIYLTGATCGGSSSCWQANISQAQYANQAEWKVGMDNASPRFDCLHPLHVTRTSSAPKLNHNTTWWDGLPYQPNKTCNPRKVEWRLLYALGDVLWRECNRPSKYDIYITQIYH